MRPLQPPLLLTKLGKFLLGLTIHDRKLLFSAGIHAHLSSLESFIEFPRLLKQNMISLAASKATHTPTSDNGRYICTGAACVTTFFTSYVRRHRHQQQHQVLERSGQNGTRKNKTKQDKTYHSDAGRNTTTHDDKVPG